MKTFDCIVCGSCVLDILVRPVPLDVPIGDENLLRVEPIEVAPGGIVSNAGIAMARLGMRVAAKTYVGDDEWGTLLRSRYAKEEIDATYLKNHPTVGTSTTAVLIDEGGRRSFAHCVGATKSIEKSFFLESLDLFAQSRMMLLGYYPLMPMLQDDLPEVLAAIRETGCQTALDSAGDGGAMKPLDRILPHLDVFVPSINEASHQTGLTEPTEILEAYRNHGAPGLLGVKLGAKGALLSPTAGQYIEIPAITPPAPLVDTTGAGDCFYGGLLTGLLNGLSPTEAGRLAAAVGAHCVTGLGATAALRNYEETAKLAFGVR